MNTIMSTSIIPDIYRHTARKSTVSRNVKSQVKTVASLPVTNTCKEEPSIFETIQCDIKLESDSLPMEQSFVIIPDNEIEQMVVEQTNDEIIRQIIEQIQNQIQNDVLIQLMDVNPNCTSISMDIHHTIDAMMDRLEENMCDRNIDTTNNESIVTVNEVHTRNVTSSINEDASMESEQRSSMLSRSHMNDDDDIVEIENVSRSDPHPPLCTCQCHQNAPNSTADYLLFEQALRQTRQEQQKERSLNNNRLIQTLKRQHQELMTFYQRQLYINKIDREQQTMQINHNDTQIQTDISTMQPPVSKSNNLQANGKHSTPNTKPSPPVPVRPFNSFLTPIRTKGPSLQQLIPCLTTTTTSTTTTVTNKISMIKKPATVPVVPQDIVDLTEEDDDNNNNNNNKNRSLTSSRPQQNPVTNTTPATTTTTSLQATTRSNPSTPIGQMFPLRPLPEQTSVDSKIARPQLSITQDNAIVRLTWNLPSTPMEWIQNYEIYAYKYSVTASTTDWKKIGTVKSMRLPMAVTLKEFQPNSHYAFAVRGVSTTNQMGPFCEPKTIFTGTTTTPNSSQILNGSS